MSRLALAGRRTPLGIVGVDKDNIIVNLLAILYTLDLRLAETFASMSESQLIIAAKIEAIIGVVKLGTIMTRLWHDYGPIIVP